MNILICNVGSTSLKYQLFAMDEGEQVIASGGAERVGGQESRFYWTENGAKRQERLALPTHREAIERMLRQLPPEAAVDCVGFKVVHAKGVTGVQYLTDDVLAAMDAFNSVAPAHNPPYLAAIRQFHALMPGVPLIGSFETAFHAQMPPEASLYPISWELSEQYAIRRYGFHGASHEYMTEFAAEKLGRRDFRLISCHLGGSGALAAVRDGRSIDTTMGLTPTEGLMMGTRCGDVDPGALLFLMEKHNLNYRGMLDVVNKLSGVSGVTGISPDMREINAAAEEGDERAKLALDMYENRVIKYVGAFTAEMNGVDIIVFTGGVGEHQASIRANVCHSLAYMGVQVDEEVNQANNGEEQVISAENSSVKVVVIPTDEEYMIAKDTEAIVEGREP